MMSQWPGIHVEDWNVDWTSYEGTQDALIRTGLFFKEWFPGQPGNGAGSSTFVFLDENKQCGYIKKPGDGRPREYGFGRVRISSSGLTFRDSTFRAWVFHPPAEVERRKLQKAACTGADEWQLAKDARVDKQGVLQRWKNVISGEIANFERLCTGERYFVAMPDVRIKGDDLARVRDAVENLRLAFAQSVPVIPDIEVRSNVYSIRDGVHRGLKKTC